MSAYVFMQVKGKKEYLGAQKMRRKKRTPQPKKSSFNVFVLMNIMNVHARRTMSKLRWLSHKMRERKKRLTNLLLQFFVSPPPSPPFEVFRTVHKVMYV